MPTSADIFDSDYQSFINIVKPQKILDIGPGAGKYEKLTREVLHCQIDAVEIDSDYIEKYNLKERYNNIVISDTKEYCLKNSSIRYDVVIFGDVLEHMFRSDAMDVLDFMLYRSKYIYCMWPNNYLQDAYDGHESEAHRSNFTIKDLADHGFDIIYMKKRRFGDERMTVCILQGYKNKEELIL
jgi:predicted TPR repeat methyltransferase